MHVCVLGAGITGLAAAYELQRRGHTVTVVDQAPAAGLGASGGNGAQLSYSYVQPLADPSIWMQLPHLLLSPASPLKLRPRLDPQQWRWALAFMAACRGSVSRETTAQLLALAAQSREAFDAMRADLQPDCDYSETGKLVLYGSQSGLDGAARQVELQRALGSVQSVVTPAQCVAIEPALAEYAVRIAGAVHTPGECAADCLKVCRALAVALGQRGVPMRLGTRVSGLEMRAGVLHAVRTADGPLEADAFVMALGTASYPLGRQAGVTLPLYPLKGYSTTLDVGGLGAGAPTVNVTDSARKVVFARIGSRLRVAGMAEIVGHDDRIPAGRIETLRQATAAVFPRAAEAPELERWTGMRPATPTARPILGRLPGAPRNLLFNTGHGALGFTLAFGTARHVAQLLEAPAA